MKTLSTPVSTQAAAVNSGWVELYDFYLSASIATPWGTTNIIRLCTLPNGFSFFAPTQSPEPAGTQGNAQTYQYWPIKREVVKGDTKFQDDRLQITASNVSSQFASLLALVNWYDTPVVIRKVPLFQTGLTSGDCVVLFSGLVDSISITAQALQFTCSSSLGALNSLLPSENMHASCRFRFGDDQCTIIKYLPENYLAGTCGAGSSTTNIKSSDLTQDSGSSSGYGTDLVDALADGAITASSSSNTMVNVACAMSLFKLSAVNNFTIGAAVVFSANTMPSGLTAGVIYYVVFKSTKDPTVFSVSASIGGAPISVGYGAVNFKISSANLDYINAAVTINPTSNIVQKTAHGLANNYLVTFSAATLPAPLVAGFAYYVVNATVNNFQLALTPGGAAIDLTTAGTTVLVTAFLPGAGPAGVKASNFYGWSFGLASDWGTQIQGYYQIPDAQAGLKNGALTPWIQFDFGSAVSPKVWQVASFAGVQPEQRVRLIEFFSSSNGSTWNFESYYEVPRLGAQLFDVLIPNASSARYWRICVRSRWAEQLYYLMFSRVSAYAGSRNWWLNGQITFDGNVTPALANKTVAVRSSYSGEIFCAPLPVAPASGDTFIIKRGCGRAFNDCCARGNTENYGGFNDLELQNVIQALAQ